MPGVPVVYRLAEARNQNPEQLNLDRRKITVCPLLEGEGRLRLLNYQNNQIHHMCNFHNLPHLIFLDLYNNRIAEIANLDCVPGLRVLMLGKNKITRIENLTPLLKLDVLDLHSNRITEVAGLNHLKDLRVLNLAGNQIREVTDLGGLRALTELNLRRNRLEVVAGLDELPSLQRLFLSNNNVTSFDNIDCIFKTRSLVELAIDGNPVVAANLDSYRQTLVNRIRSLKHLDLRRVTDDERRNADAELRRSHEQQREQELLQRAAGARESAIRAVRDSWAHEFEQATGRAFADVVDDGTDDGGAGDGDDHDGGEAQAAAVSDGADSDADGGTGAEDGHRPSSRAESRPDSRGSTGRPSTAPSHRRRRPPTITTQRPRVTGLSSLHLYPNGAGGGSSGTSVRTHSGVNPVSRVFWELESCDDARTLRVYGAAFSAFDESKVHRLATCVSMLYVSFDLAVAKALRRLSALPKLRELQFRYNNLHSLHQVRALAARIPTSVTRLTVKNNAVTKSPLFKPYVAHTMPHLVELNGDALTPEDRVKAHAMFQPMEDALAPPPPAEERRVGPASRRRPRSARDGSSKKRPRSFRRLARATASSRSGRAVSGRDSARDSSRDSNRDGASEADGGGSGATSATAGAVAEFAKLVKAVKPPAAAVGHVARRVVSDAVRHAMSVETQLKEINQVWPDVVKRLVQETLEDLAAPDSSARLQAQLEALL